MTLWRVVSLEVPNHKERKRTRRQMKVLESKVRLGLLFQFMLFEPPIEIKSKSSFVEKTLKILIKAFYANVGKGRIFLPGNCKIQDKLRILNKNGKLNDDCIKTTYQ